MIKLGQQYTYTFEIHAKEKVSKENNVLSL